MRRVVRLTAFGGACIGAAVAAVLLWPLAPRATPETARALPVGAILPQDAAIRRFALDEGRGVDAVVILDGTGRARG